MKTRSSLSTKDSLDKISFVMYGPKKVPRFVELSKKAYWLIFTLPSLYALLATFFILLGLSYFNEIRNLATRKDPETIEKLKKENEQIKKDIQEMADLNKQLQDNLANAYSQAPTATTSATPTDSTATPTKIISAGPTSNFETLALFKGGNIDSKATFPAFTIEDAEALVQGQNIYFRFNIVNLGQSGEKLAGHIFVLMKDDSALYFYPADVFVEGDVQVAFNKGESFATTKFRPVEAIFPRPKHSSKFTFKLIIFSKLGQLIHKQLFQQELKL